MRNSIMFEGMFNPLAVLDLWCGNCRKKTLANLVTYRQRPVLHTHEEIPRFELMYSCVSCGGKLPLLNVPRQRGWCRKCNDSILMRYINVPEGEERWWVWECLRCKTHYTRFHHIDKKRSYSALTIRYSEVTLEDIIEAYRKTLTSPLGGVEAVRPFLDLEKGSVLFKMIVKQQPQKEKKPEEEGFKGAVCQNPLFQCSGCSQRRECEDVSDVPCAGCSSTHFKLVARVGEHDIVKCAQCGLLRDGKEDIPPIGRCTSNDTVMSVCHSCSLNTGKTQVLRRCYIIGRNYDDYRLKCTVCEKEHYAWIGTTTKLGAKKPEKFCLRLKCGGCGKYSTYPCEMTEGPQLRDLPCLFCDKSFKVSGPFKVV